jgi:hypothetical protein
MTKRKIKTSPNCIKRDGMVGENVKTSQHCIMRDAKVQENIMLESSRKGFVTIMVCVTMAQRSATLCKAAGSTFSPRTVLWNSRGSGRSSLSWTLKGRPKAQLGRQRGKGSQCVCQKQDQRNNQRAQP